MKIQNFKDLEGITARGLTCRVKGMEYKGVTPSYYRINIEGKGIFSEGFYEGNDLKDCIDSLREIGFYILEMKIEDHRSLTEILKQYIRPTNFKYDCMNFYFLPKDEGDIVYVVWEDRNEVFRGFYFDIIEDTRNLLEEYIAEKEITIKQVYNSLKELGWI